MHKSKAQEVALTGMLFALCMALSWLESALAPFFGLLPAMKLGLANICVMYALLFLRPGTAAMLVVLKAGFAFLTRGATAGVLSLCGGALSLLVLWLLLVGPLPVSGYIFSVCGALAHNIGQLAAAAVLLSAPAALGYAPVLLVVGLIVGAGTAAISRAVFPALARALPPANGKGQKIFRL